MTVREAGEHIAEAWGGELAVVDGNLDIRIRVEPDQGTASVGRPRLVAACETLIAAEEHVVEALKRKRELPSRYVGAGGALLR
jgi:hypothetical protein